MTYLERELSWRRILRPASDNYEEGFWDLISNDDQEEIRQLRVRSMGQQRISLSFFKNNTYRVTACGEVVTGSILEDWDITGQPFLRVAK